MPKYLLDDKENASTATISLIEDDNTRCRHSKTERNNDDISQVNKTSEASVEATPMRVMFDIDFKAAVIGGCLLSVNGGFINAVAIVEAGFSVSHMTGNVSNAAINLDEGDFGSFWWLTGLLISYMAGCVITGLVGGEYENFRLGHSYGRIFCIGFILLVSALCADIVLHKSKFVFLALCAASCGLQNSMTTKFSGSMIRTSHITGAVTDIGLLLGRMLRGRRENMWRLGLLVPTTLCFFIGAALGSEAHKSLGRASLIVNCVLYGFTAVLYTISFTRRFGVSKWTVLFGKEEYDNYQ